MTAVVSSGNRKLLFSRPFHSLARTALWEVIPDEVDVLLGGAR
jgi:hypothetical protein